MNDEDVIDLMYEYHKGLFPKVCAKCGRVYSDLRDYILNTERIMGEVCYDAELGSWEPKQPVGGVALANCECGSTLALSTADVPAKDMQRVLEWLKRETVRRDKTVKELLGWVRDEVRKKAVGEGERAEAVPPPEHTARQSA